MVGYQFRPCLLDAVKRVNTVLGSVLDFKFYNTYDVDNEIVDHRRFADDLRNSQVVLLDVRGGDIVSKIICEELNALKNTVVVFVGGSPEIINLTRLGNFSFKSFTSLREKPVLGKLFRKGRMVYSKTMLKRRRSDLNPRCMDKAPLFLTKRTCDFMGVHKMRFLAFFKMIF
jgi:hypothetical protein